MSRVAPRKRKEPLASAADDKIWDNYEEFCRRHRYDPDDLKTMTEFYVEQFKLQQTAALNSEIRSVIYGAIAYYFMQGQALLGGEEEYDGQVARAQGVAREVMTAYTIGRVTEYLISEIPKRLPTYTQVQQRLRDFGRALSSLSSPAKLFAAASTLMWGAQASVTQDANGREIYDFPKELNGTTIIQAPTDVSTEVMIKIAGEVFAGNALPREDAPNVWSLNGYDLTRVGNDLIITQAGIPSTSSNNITVKNFNFNAANEQLGISLNKAAQVQTHAIGTINSAAWKDRAFPLNNRAGRFVYLKKQTINGNIILSVEICNRVGIPVKTQALASLPVTNAGALVSENDIVTAGQAAQLPDGTVVFEFAVNQISRNAAGAVPTNPASNSSLCIAAISPDGSDVTTGVLASNRVRSTSGFIYTPSNIVLNAGSSRMIATYAGISSSGFLTSQNNVEFNQNAQPISAVSSGLEVPGFGAQNALSSFTLNTGDVVSVGKGTLSFIAPNLIPARNNTVDILVDQTLPQYFLPAQNCSVSVSPAVDEQIPEIVIPNAPRSTYIVNLNGNYARLNLQEIGIQSNEVAAYLREASESEILPQDALGKGAIFTQPNVDADIHPMANISQSLYNPRFAVLELPQGQRIIINGFPAYEIAQNYTRFFADTPTLLTTESTVTKAPTALPTQASTYPPTLAPTVPPTLGPTVPPTLAPTSAATSIGVDTKPTNAASTTGTFQASSMEVDTSTLRQDTSAKPDTSAQPQTDSSTSAAATASMFSSSASARTTQNDSGSGEISDTSRASTFAPTDTSKPTDFTSTFKQTTFTSRQTDPDTATESLASTSASKATQADSTASATVSIIADITNATATNAPTSVSDATAIVTSAVANATFAGFSTSAIMTALTTIQASISSSLNATAAPTSLPSSSSQDGLSTGAIAGIVAGGIVVCSCLSFALAVVCNKMKNRTRVGPATAAQEDLPPASPPASTSNLLLVSETEMDYAAQAAAQAEAGSVDGPEAESESDHEDDVRPVLPTGTRLKRLPGAIPKRPTILPPLAFRTPGFNANDMEI